MSKTYAVIASNSFSGGWMVDTLFENDPDCHVIGMSRSKEYSDLFVPYKSRKDINFTFHQIDINTDTEKMFTLLDEYRPSHIINFAAQGEVGTSWKYPEHWFETNAVGTVKLCNFLKDKDYLKRYVHISTPEVYGSCDNVREDAPIDPTTPYAASKAAGDLFIFTLIKQFNFPAVLIRSTNVYGKHQQLYRIIPRTVINIRQGKKLPLQGGGKAEKSYIHIKDVCLGILAALEKGKDGAVYHLSPDESISIRDLVQKICDYMKVNFDDAVEIVADRPGQDARYVLDSSKARQELSWAPQTNFDTALNEMIDWVNDNFESIIQEPLEYVHIP